MKKLTSLRPLPFDFLVRNRLDGLSIFRAKVEKQERFPPQKWLNFWLRVFLRIGIFDFRFCPVV